MARRTLIWALLTLLVTGTLSAQEPAERERQDAAAGRAAERLRALHEESDRLAAEERTIIGELRRLEVERQIRTTELLEVQRKLTGVVQALANLDRQIATLERQELTDTPALRARLVSLYKLGGGSYARLLLSTSDARHIGQASRMVSALAAQDRSRIEAHQRRLADLNTSRTALQQQRTELASLRAQAARARTAADDAVEARNLLVRQIDARRDMNAQLAGELEAAQQRLQTTFGALGTSGAPAAAAALPIAPFKGDLIWPADGTLRQGFGASLSTRAAPATGIDIAAPEDSEVQAVHDGVVAFADLFTGFGRLVIIDHGERAFSLYGNLKDVTATQGAHVQQGQRLGSVGVTPTGAAGLYFELRIDARPVDPLQWLKKR